MAGMEVSQFTLAPPLVNVCLTMRVSQGLLVLSSLLCCYFYTTLAHHGHGKEWGKHESNWKKGGHHHGEGVHGGKYKDDDWDKRVNQGTYDNYDKGGNKHDNYRKHHGGKDDFGKYTSGGDGFNAWGGENKQGGINKVKNIQDQGRNNKGFRNTYSKTENGDQTNYHDVSDQGNFQKDYNDRDNWKKYGGEKFYKGEDGNVRFDEGERGEMYKSFGDSGRDRHDGGGYDSGADNHQSNYGHQDNGGKRFSDHEDVGRRGHSSGSRGGYGGHDFGGHHH